MNQEIYDAVYHEMRGGATRTPLDVLRVFAGDAERKHLAWTSEIIEALDKLAEEGKIYKREHPYYSNFTKLMDRYWRYI